MWGQVTRPRPVLKTILALFAPWLFAAEASAGIACPNVDIQYLGSPRWLDNDEILDSLISRQSWTGMASSHHEQGLLVTGIVQGSSADRAGLLENDILLRVDGTPASDRTDLDDLAPGSEVSLTVSRHGAVIPIEMTIGHADPVHIALGQALEPDDRGCPYATLGIASEAIKKLVMRTALTKQRRFRCEDAHEALSFFGSGHSIEEAYLIRGSRRLLLTVPSFGTACIASEELDGDALTPDAARDFLMQAVSRFLDFQEANP